MTAQEKKRIAYWVGLLIVLLPLMVAAADSRYAKTSDLQQIGAKLDRILDAVCDSSQTRVCR